MTNQTQLLAEAQLYVRGVLADDASGHDWWHIYRVTQLAKTIALEEQADVFVCTLAAILHDIADEKLNTSKAEGLSKVNSWMNNHQVNSEAADHIMLIISTMSYSGGQNKPMETLEGQIVQDADRLDALGAIGIARTFAYSGWKGQLMYDPQMPPRDQITAEQYRQEKSTAINHFHEKLLKLKDRMNTPYGARLAQERHRFMEQFLEQFHKEWDYTNGDEEQPHDLE